MNGSILSSIYLYVQCHNSNFRPPSRARPMHGGCLCFSVYRKPKVSFCRDRPHFMLLQKKNEQLSAEHFQSIHNDLVFRVNWFSMARKIIHSRTVPLSTKYFQNYIGGKTRSVGAQTSSPYTIRTWMFSFL